MTTLGKYEILAELGAGSMGIIYRARDTVLDREVALKTFAQAGSLDPELKERFYREARFCARLHHPNIVTIYDLGEQEGMAFISMELLTGRDLRKFIVERDVLPAADKVRIMSAVCAGLQHAHESGIIHRDIKPSNILLTRENVPKILDFGIARFPSSRLTMMGRVLGTPHYMAPEQIMGKPCDARSDIFAVGLVTFEFLTFAHPFFGESIPKRIINDAPDSLLSRNPELPPTLEPVIAKALARDPAQRWQTAGEFSAALLQALETPSREDRVYAAAAPVAAPPPPSPKPAQIPANANTEFKMSEVLAALQSLDAALERQDLEAARTAVATIERIAEIDDVYATAAEQSRARLGELEALAPPPPHPPPAATPAPAFAAAQLEAGTQTAAHAPPAWTSAAPSWGASNKVGETSTSGTSSASVTASPEPIKPPVAEPATRPAPSLPPPPAPLASSDVTRFFGNVDVASPVLAPPPPPPPFQARPAPAPGPTPPPAAAPAVATKVPAAPKPATPAATNKKIGALIVGGAIAAAIIVVGAVAAFLVMHRGSVAKAPFVATAEVTVPQAQLYAAPDSSDVLVTLKRGDPVNVISAPRSRDQEWTEVQSVRGKVYPPGAMRTSDLTNWSSTQPDTAWTLLLAFAPTAAASQSETQQYAARVSQYMQDFPNSPHRAEAQAELARLNSSPATSVTAAASPTPSVARPPTRPTSPPPEVSRQPFSPEAGLKRATTYWEQGQYDRAEAVLRRVLADKPDYKPARDLLARVQKAKVLEGGR